MASMSDQLLEVPEETAADWPLGRRQGRGTSRGFAWSYEEAFKRNRGLISEAEQQKLRNSRVAIAGMGGVGGVHLMTLARLGIGKFTIADPDVFEVANFNRQYGGTISNLGRNKAEAMAELVRGVNPEIDLRIVPDAIDRSNAEEFLRGADLFIDSLDAFCIPVRRLLFQTCAARGICAIGAGPVGFSTVWVAFAPDGMSFDEYFDLTDDQDENEQFIRYIAGMAPKATHRSYIDASEVSFSEKRGPSASAACQLCSGVLGVESLKLLLGRGRLSVAPRYQQFDPFTGSLKRGKLHLGNRGPIQRLKIWYLRRLLYGVR